MNLNVINTNLLLNNFDHCLKYCFKISQHILSVKWYFYTLFDTKAEIIFSLNHCFTISLNLKVILCIFECVITHDKAELTLLIKLTFKLVWSNNIQYVKTTISLINVFSPKEGDGTVLFNDITIKILNSKYY